MCASRRKARPPSVLVLVPINNNKNKLDPSSGSVRSGPLGSHKPRSPAYGKSTSLGPAPRQPAGSARISARSRSVHALLGLCLVAAAHVPAGPRGGRRSQRAAVPGRAAVFGCGLSCSLLSQENAILCSRPPFTNKPTAARSGTRVPYTGRVVPVLILPNPPPPEFWFHRDPLRAALAKQLHDRNAPHRGFRGCKFGPVLYSRR